MDIFYNYNSLSNYKLEIVIESLVINKRLPLNKDFEK